METSSYLRVDWVIGVLPVTIFDSPEVLSQVQLPLNPSIELVGDILALLLKFAFIDLPQFKKLVPHIALDLLEMRLDFLFKSTH